MEPFLDRITAARRADAGARAREGALERAREEAARGAPALDFEAALRAPGMSLIAEIKRSSPSAGPIRVDVDPRELARAYADAGVAAISVLTEPEHFAGSLEDLRSVRDAVRVPVLRKDFLCEPLHLWEARAAGADAVLLIVAALSQTELVALLDLAGALGMAALVEVHEPDEVSRAVDAGARIVGINTRDLKTLTVDPRIVGRIRPLVPDHLVVVGESGVSSRDDVAALEALACDAVLVGEALMRAADPGQKVRELLGSA